MLGHIGPCPFKIPRLHKLIRTPLVVLRPLDHLDYTCYLYILRRAISLEVTFIGTPTSFTCVTSRGRNFIYSLRRNICANLILNSAAGVITSSFHQSTITSRSTSGPMRTSKNRIVTTWHKGLGHLVRLATRTISQSSRSIPSKTVTPDNKYDHPHPQTSNSTP